MRCLLPRLLIGLLLSAWACTALAGSGGIGGGSPVDPNFTFPVPGNYGLINSATSGLTLRPQTVNTGIRNLIIIAAGQSNIVDVAPTAYTPTNPAALDDLNIVDGAIYAAVDPLLGCSLGGPVGNQTGHPILRLADALVTANKFDRVIIVPVAIGGTLVADWQSSFPSNRIQAALNRIAAHGIVAGTNVTIIILWGQGESDNLAGTTQVNYTNSLNAVIAASRAAGFNGTWFVAKQTYAAAVSAPVQAAQAAVVNHPSGVWAGANADALVGNVCGAAVNAACRIADNTHWTDAGSYSYAIDTTNGWQQALHAFGAPF